MEIAKLPKKIKDQGQLGTIRDTMKSFPAVYLSKIDELGFINLGTFF